MVHQRPDANGRMVLERDPRRTGFLVLNLSTANNIVITPMGKLPITLPPYSKLRVPDSTQILFQGDSSERNYIVLEYAAGAEV